MKSKKKYIWNQIRNLCIVQIFLSLLFFFIMFIPTVSAVVRDYVVKGYAIENMVFVYLIYLKGIRPMNEINKAFYAFGQGYTVEDIFNLRYGINADHEAMLIRLQSILNTEELIKSSRKQAEYLALQNQINPHFLYNTLEGIRSEALIKGVNSVAEMAEALAKFFRYTIANLDTLVTVEDELENVKNYWLIQQFRFGEHISLSIEYEEQDEKNILSTKIPKLILQPAVENSIRHGIEPMIEAGNVTIRFQLTDYHLIIIISDNGVGMDETTLDKINNQLRDTQISVDEKSNKKMPGGIAMANVNNRIKLIFGDKYGLCYYSTVGLGTDVEITIPIC